MPRRGRRGERRGGDAEEVDEEDPRRERTHIFARTKMCKFYILGCCSRGDSCHFAHNKEQLSSLPDLFRTKLCRTLINTGVCNDEECRYAHSKEELRTVEGFTGAMNPRIAEAATKPKAQQPAVQQPIQPQANFSAANLEQLMMLQLGSQAHAIEAARLHTIAAACLQAGGLNHGAVAAFAPVNGATMLPGGMPPTAFGFPGQPLPQLGAQQLQPQPALMQHASQHVGAPGSAVPGLGGRSGGKGYGSAMTNTRSGGRTGAKAGGKAQGPLAAQRNSHGDSRKGVGPGPNVFVKNTFISVAEDDGSGLTPIAGRLRPVKTADAALHSLAGQGDDDEDEDGTPPDPHAPVQINFGSLRSLSNQSLSRLAEDCEAAEALSKEKAAGGCAGNVPDGMDGGPDHVNWRVKNTFLDFEAAAAPLAGRLRPVFSAAGRLDALAEASQDSDGLALDTPPWPGSQPGMQGRTSAGSPALSFVPEHSHYGFDRQANHYTGGVGSSGAGEALVREMAPATEKRSQDTPLAPSLCRLPAGAPGAAEVIGHTLADTLGTGITVKNTFLDFAPEEPARAPLRAVHTAAGRLDLMGQD